jgi:AcrR family transcriptional regulator
MTRRSPVQSNHVLPPRQSSEPPVTSPSEEPAWKQRAVERSIKTAKLRAAQRVQRFLDAAQSIIIEKGSTDFTVQEVVDRSRQSLRSFYLQFDGKHELLLALFEDALSRSAEQIRAATTNHADPAERLKIAVELLFEASRPDPTAKRPLFTDFAPRLLVSHPEEVKFADRVDGGRQRRRRTARRRQPEADRRNDHADRHVHCAVQRRVGRCDRAPHHRR